MEGLVTKALLVLFASVINEAVNEFFFTPFLDLLRDRIDETVRVQIIRLWSGIVGIGIAYEFQLMLFAMMGTGALHPWADIALTGLLLGRGSNFIHDLLKRFVLGNEDRELTNEYTKADTASRFK